MESNKQHKKYSSLIQAFLNLVIKYFAHNLWV